MEEKYDVVFKRKAYDKMIKWKNDYAPNYALFLKGARRVGKTTLAQTFARNEFKSFIEIRFDKADDEIKDLFVHSLENLDEMFLKIQMHYKTKLFENESVIILDEIQLFPQARQALKTLLEDHRYAYIETGSLATIRKKANTILIPSEEYSIDVLPMDFEEFLWACNDTLTMSCIKEHFKSLKPYGSLLKEIKHTYREYMLVGGMPQAVNEFIHSKDYGKVDMIKQMILNLYEEDIDNQNEENPTYVKSFFSHIPSELSKHDKTYTLSHIDPKARIREYKGPISWLDEAMIINISECVNDPSAAFNLSTINPSFKCYMMDTGLLISLAYKNQDYLENDLYKAILFDKLHVNEGMIIENITAQCLRANGENVFFYKKVNEKTRKVSMEIDFIIRRNNKVIPIEAKSSNADSINSLSLFKKTFSNRIGAQYVLYDGDIKRENEIIYLPYFMASII